MLFGGVDILASRRNSSSFANWVSLVTLVVMSRKLVDMRESLSVNDCAAVPRHREVPML
jgi:hypothetical protein